MKTEKEKCRFWLIIFTTSWFIVGSLLPILILQNDYIDLLEWVTQGRQLQFGYDRHPYLFAWITRFAYDLVGGHLWILYIMSQISILIMFICVWKLANKFLRPYYSLLAVLSLFFIQFYTTTAFEFNNDVGQLPLWSLIALFFYYALKYQKTRSWILVGIFAGCSMMVKYFSLSLFLPMFLISVFTKEGRASYKKPGIYIACVIFLVIVTPNFIWLYNHDFVSIRFAMMKTDLLDSKHLMFFRHIIEPALVILSAFGVAIIPIIALFLCFGKSAKEKISFNKFSWIFVSFLAFGALASTILFSLITGGSVKYAYTTTDFIFMGIFFLMIWQPKISKNKLKRCLYLIIIMFFVLISFFLWNSIVTPYLKGHGGYQQFPGKMMSKIITEKWNNKFKIPVKYVIGDRKLSCNFAVYSKDNPVAYFSANNMMSDWVTDKDILQKGAVILWRHSDKTPYPRFNKYAVNYTPLNLKWAINPIMKNIGLGLTKRKMKPVVIYYAFIPPKRDR